MFGSKLNSLIIAAGLTASSAMAVELTTDLQMGVRNSDFNAAPREESLWTQEIGASLLAQPIQDLPISGGLRVGYQEMRGSLGTGLTHFNGFPFGPEFGSEIALGAWRPFGRIAYQWGRFDGRGTSSWAENDSMSLFSFGDEAVTSSNKRFTSRGVHVAVGTAYDFTKTISGLARLDLGFDTMEAKDRVVAYGEDLEKSGKSQFNSRAVLLGGQMSL